MIEAALAKKYIEQMAQYTEYNINIMNEKGIIIASCDPKRIGTFHDVAYYIVTGTEDLVVTSHDRDYPGVKPGINMVICVDGKREGVVGLTGNPEEIRPVAMILKVAIEAMMKYEKQQKAILYRQNRKEQFLNFLTHDAYADPAMIRTVANQLHYSEEIVRIPILCRLKNMEAEFFLNRIKNDVRHNKEDLSFLLDENHILIYKTMPGREDEIFADYKYLIAEYLSDTLRWLRKEEKEVKFYVGSFQSSFTQYYYAYRHCTWLEENIEAASTALYFYDYSGKYIRSVIPVNELQRMFNVHEARLGKAFLKSFQELAEALIQNNYNLVLAAKALYIHKNTLIYRYSKMKAMLNIDPITSCQDRLFMEGFYNYLIKEH